MPDTNVDPQTLDDIKFAFGRDDLGPAVAGYLQKLLQTCHYFADARGAKILFCARAGVRIRHCLDVYLSRCGQTVPESWELFWVSRMMIAKGIWSKAPKQASELFDKEFRHTPLETANECIVGRPDGGSKDTWRHTRKPSGVGKALRGRRAEMSGAVAHLDEQSVLFEKELKRILGDHTSCLLVDTGWMGTSQRLLQAGYGDIEWWGAYFGLSANEHDGASRAHWSRALGLVFQSDTVDTSRPETCVVEHRHMIEDLFEPNGPSIEKYETGPDGAVRAIGAEVNLADSDDVSGDPIYAGVLEYLRTAPRDPAAVAAAEAAAWKRLQKRVLTPTREQTRVFMEGTRSADFGKPIDVPILMPADETTTAEERIGKALWRAGQIALEYEDGMADAVQRRRFGLDYGYEAKPRPLPANPAIRPKVAVITRTMDRPMLLRRALLSVHNQTYRDYLQVVVCDGGNPDFVKAAIADTNIDHSKVLLVDNVVNRGMEAASNVAIQSCDSEFIVIHDDDDSWDPKFLQETVTFLESSAGAEFGGVLTRSVYVSESVHPDGIRVHQTRPYNPDLTPPTFHSMMHWNTFAPISFLFRRSAYDDVGPFHEDYPVLGDWEFNLRFLERYNMAVIAKDLAYYHHRDTGDMQSFGNSVISGIDKHAKQLSIMRNAFLRRAADGPVETAAASSLNLTVKR